MNNYELHSISFLDKIRINDGIDKLTNFFYNLLNNNPSEAIGLVNASNLQYTTLFILEPIIRDTGYFGQLNFRNTCALDITKNVLMKKTIDLESQNSNNKQMMHSVSRWILETGYSDDGLNGQFEQVMDVTALYMVKIFKDNSVLHIISDLIFKRNRNGFYTYDLIWALFESEHPQSLVLLANHLRSPHQKDVELSYRLLSFIPGMDADGNREGNRGYNICVQWINENLPFLYSTGETLHQSCKATPYAVSLHAKYLCKPLDNDKREISDTLTPKEQNLLNQYNRLNLKEKTMLSNYSFFLYRQNQNLWSIWRDKPLGEQMHIAANVMGGLA